VGIAVTEPAPTPAPAEEIAFRARGLTVRFGGLAALRGVDLVVGAGEVVALAGENGAGKTTLVRCLAGDLLPSSGSVECFGRPVAGDAAVANRLGIAVVWQDLALCDNLDVAANLLLGKEGGFGLISEARLHRRASVLLERLGIPLRDTTALASSLSGGQRQLLAVARAMRDHPRCVILDEPTSSLGVKETAEVEGLVATLRASGVTVVLVTHDVDQMFRLADRIVVFRNGAVVGTLRPDEVHPDDVIALMSGQPLDSSARGQLTRLHGLIDRLASVDRSASLLLILSTLGAALRVGRLSIHVREGDVMTCVASVGLPESFLDRWSSLPLTRAGGPVARAILESRPVIDENVRTSPEWSMLQLDPVRARVASACAVPFFSGEQAVGVITVLHSATGLASRDEIDLITLYAGYAASAFEREQMFAEATARNRVLETLREVLESLAGAVPDGGGLSAAVGALRAGVGAEEVALISTGGDAPSRVRASANALGRLGGPPSPSVRDAADVALRHPGSDDDVLVAPPSDRDDATLAVTFPSPGGRSALVGVWSDRVVPEGAGELLADAAHSFHLALEREEAARALQEAEALRRSHELQRVFLSRLSHELRTPLTAIQGYASSLMQPDVVWDGESERRFLSRIAEESARLGRLVGDLLDFSAIESGVLRLHRDWCEIPLVLEAAASLLPEAGGRRVAIRCAEDLPVVWADHDRLEQVFLNLFDNAIRHNPPDTEVLAVASRDGMSTVVVTVSDTGRGVPNEIASAPFAPGRRTLAPTSGSGLGLSIAKAIVDAHGGGISLKATSSGTRFTVRLPVEFLDTPSEVGDA
jgi:signal transduction histidine kinase/ABC-type multidrug transport system ATPase subunit